MKFKNKILLKISFLTGVIPLLGGWSIFLIWLAGRHLNASDFADLEIVGFFWMLICFWVAIVGILILGIYVLINRKSLHIGMFVSLLIILLNIPSVFVIVPWQGKQDKQVFIKLFNETGLDNINFTLIGKTETVKIGNLNDADTKVYHYEPRYSFMGERIYQEPDSLRLVLSGNQIQDTIDFPTLRQGACRHVIVDSNLKITSP